MTRIEKIVIECDVCSQVFDEDSDYTKECAICNNDICEDCQYDHSKEECEF